MTELQQEIKRLYLLNIPNKNIAILTGKTIGQVNRVIYKVLELQSKNQKLTGNEIQEAKMLRQKGMKVREIRDHLGISLNRVNQLLGA